MAVIAGTILLAPSAASACSCMGTTLGEQAADLDYVFTGQLIASETIDDVADNGLRLVFEVERVYKGEITTPFTIYSHAQGSACGVSFTENVTTGVVAREWQGVPNTSLCDQVMDVSKAGLARQFGDGIAPLRFDPALLDSAGDIDVAGGEEAANDRLRWEWLALAAAALIALSAGAAFIRRRAR